MKKNRIELLLLVFLLAIILLVQAEENVSVAKSGVALKLDSIKAEPYHDAKVVGTLNKGDSVEIRSREGGWFKIKSSGKDGWVRMLSIRRSEANTTRSTANSLFELASGRLGTGTVVITTGIRGLNEENLQAARFNARQLDILESFRVSKIEARQFATAGKLKAQFVAYLKGKGI